MIRLAGRVRIGSAQAENLVLNQGVERLLVGERLWDMITHCAVGTGERATKAHHKGLQSEMLAEVEVTKSEKFEDGELILSAVAKFPGPLYGVRELGWKDSKGYWNRILSEQLLGVSAGIDVDADETLEVKFDLVVGLVQKAYPIECAFGDTLYSGKVVEIARDNPLAWSLAGKGANQGFGYWGNAVCLVGADGTEEVIEAELVEYQKGSFRRELKIELEASSGNFEGGLKALKFGTSQKGWRNAHWLWQVVFDNPIPKSDNSKAWFNLTWGVLRG